MPPMKSSEFMDKQIMGLSGSQTNDLLDLMNPQQEQQKDEEILPSYDFQPIRSVGSSISLDGARNPKTASNNLKFSGVLVPHELAKVSHEKGKDTYDVVIVAEIDRTVKKHVDNLLHALEGVSARLSQLESRTHYLESSVDELKVSIGNYNGSTDGKLRQLENILKEVQTGTQVLRDKQEIAEAQLQLGNLEASKVVDYSPPENLNTGQPDSRQQPASQQLPQPSVASSPAVPPPPSQLLSLPFPNAPPQILPQQTPPLQYQPQAPSVPSLPREPYFPPPGQSTENTHQQYQMPAQQPPPAQHYQPSSQILQYSQPMQPPQPVNPSPQLQPPLPPHHPEETAMYMPPPQTYTQNIRQPSPLGQPSSVPPPPSQQQQYYGPSSNIYEPPPLNRQGSLGQQQGGLGQQQQSFSSGYNPPPPPSGPSGFTDTYPYNSGSPSRYNGSSMKPSPFSSDGGGSSYPRLPTAQILPQALPTAGSSPGGATATTGNRVPVDDVVDKVVAMGFPRDQVRATVRRLTENGQSVDLNVVLDKLMNGGGEIQPQKGWFGR